MSRLTDDKLGYKIQAFTLRGAKMSSIQSYSPDSDELIHLGADVTITIDGVEVPFSAGDKIVLAKGVSYLFSDEIPLGV